MRRECARVRQSPLAALPHGGIQVAQFHRPPLRRDPPDLGAAFAADVAEQVFLGDPVLAGICPPAALAGGGAARFCYG